jgi:hypothetical protein
MAKTVQKGRHPALDAGSPVYKKVGDTTPRRGMTVLELNVLNNRPSWAVLRAIP